MDGQDGSLIELQFVPEQPEQDEYEGLLALLRIRGFEPRMARVPKWGPSEPPHTLIMWAIGQLSHGIADILTEVTAEWFLQLAAQEGHSPPQGTIQVMDPLSGRVFSRVRLVPDEPQGTSGVLRRGLRKRKAVALPTRVPLSRGLRV